MHLHDLSSRSVACMPKNKQGRGVKHGVLPRPTETASACPITTGSQSSLYTICSLLPDRVPEQCFQSKPHAYLKQTTRLIRFLQKRRHRASSHCPACFDRQAAVRNRPWLHLMPFQCFDPVGINDACDFSNQPCCFWPTRSVSTLS